ncbi:MAG: hypothetical protein V1899_05940 [Planctomycetota bacterium]
MRYWLLGVLMCFGLFVGGLSAEDIFAVSDIYALDPDGKCHEIVGGDFGEFAKKNNHWDAATKTIKMFAAKNEETAVQIVIPKTGKSFSGKMSNLTGPGTIPPDRATFSALLWIKHSKGVKLYPDMVIPLDGSVSGIKSFDVPSEIKGLPQANNKVGPMLFEVWVPKDAKAGVYKGTVSVLEGDKEIEKLNVQLTIFDFEMPAMPTFALDFLDYAMPLQPFGLAGERIASSGLGQPAKKVSERAKKISWQVYKLTMDNRGFENVLPYHSQRGSPVWAPPIVGKGADAKVMSWAEWDEVFAPILDGKCNKFGEPPAHFTLPFNVNYPHICDSDPAKQFDWRPFKDSIPDGPGQNAALKEFEETFCVIAAEYIKHFAEKNWTKTRFEIYYNQKPNEGKKSRNTVPWKQDEPTLEFEYKALRYFYNVTHAAFAPAKEKNLQFVTRLDIGHWNCDKMQTPDGGTAVCYKGKAYNKGNADKYLKDTVDHWVIGSTHGEGAQHLIKDYCKPAPSPVKILNYTTPGDDVLTRHYGDFAGLGFRYARIGFVGCILFKTSIECGDPENAGDAGGGDYGQYCLYNGTKLGLDGALCSRRVKLWRNAVNDFDYIEAAKKKNPAAVDTLLQKMIKVDFSANKEYRNQAKSRGFWINNNVEDFLIAKLKLAEMITGQKIGAVELQGFSDKYTPCGSASQIVRYD